MKRGRGIKVRMLATAVLFLMIQLGVSGTAGACSDVVVTTGTGIISGRNIDWPIGNTIQVSLNPRGMHRTATPTRPGDCPASWVSQYGSITVGLYFIGAYIKLDGMNEEGLSVGMLMMLGYDYPEVDSRPYLNDDNWVRYYLDNCRTVAEAVAIAPTMRVYCLVGGHLALHDATGDSAVMEYVDGELKIHRAPEYRGVLTNEPAFEEQLDNLANYQGFGGDLPLPGGVESTSRFVRATWYLQTLPAPVSFGETLGSTLGIMQNVAKPLYDRSESSTLTTILRDHTAKRYYWRSFCHPNLRYVDLSAVDFSPGTPVRVLDLNTALIGDVENHFKPDPSQLVLPRGDYDGDGNSDLAVFRALSGLWAVRGITRLYFGAARDLPVPADYTGDGTTDIGIYRGDSALWAIRNVTGVYFGGPACRPVPGDYAGDGSSDIAVFNEASGLWAVRGATRTYFGATGDFPVPGDFDGDGRLDLGLLRRRIGYDIWMVKGISSFYFGDGMGHTVAGDYDGDGTWEAARFTQNTDLSPPGRWQVRGVTACFYGLATDLPVPADYTGNGSLHPAIFRENTGLWAIRGVTRAYFGAGSDLPVTRREKTSDCLK